MEVNHNIQLVQDKAYQLFTEVEGQGAELEQVVTIEEQHLEGPINDEIIHGFVEKEFVAQQKFETAQAKLEAFDVELVRPK